MNSQSRRRAAALLEVFGVYAAGSLVADQLFRLSGLSLTNPLSNLSVNTTGAGLITASWQMFVLLMFQYAGSFLLIIPINWWYRRRGPASYGLTKAGRSWTTLLLAGLGTVALSAWLVLSVSPVVLIHPGLTAPWRQAFFEMSWRRWEFWLFAGVASYALIPPLEELFFRGYCQRRLAEDWGDGPAILGTACLFTFSHAQYQIPNLYNAGMIAGLLMSAIGFGVVFARTRSLIPSMIAHALLNIPMTLTVQYLYVAALVIGAVFIWRRGLAAVRQVFSTGSGAACGALAVAGAGYAVAAAHLDSMEFVALGLVVIAVGLEGTDRRRNRIDRVASMAA
jgi:membrane protease YdiL (CAAX protease family)